MIKLVPNLRPYFGSLRFWLTIWAAATFTIGVIRASAAWPTVAIVSPPEGATLTGNQIPVQLAVAGLQLTDYQKSPRAKVGQGHLHLWLDQSQLGAAAAIKTSATSYIFANVKPGSHTLVVEIVGNDHSSLSPPATASVRFKSVPTSFRASSEPLLLSLIAFILVAAALYLVSQKTGFKIAPRSGKRPQKSARKRPRR